MNTLINTHPEKYGPIEVFEDKTHFLVRIHPKNRERVKRIPGRQWDGARRLWVFLKTPTAYDALVKNFKADADRFEIQPAESSIVDATPKGALSEDDSYQETEEFGKSQGIDEQLDRIQEVIGFLKDMTVSQNRQLADLQENHGQALKILLKLEPSPQPSAQPEPVEVLPSELNLTNRQEIELLENALKLIASLAVKADKQFCALLNKYKPLLDPHPFVFETHEYVRQQLGILVGDEKRQTKFSELITRAKEEGLIYEDINGRPGESIRLLHALNNHRNFLAHPTSSRTQDKWESYSRAIIYLMNLALVWPKIVQDVENSND